MFVSVIYLLFLGLSVGLRLFLLRLCCTDKTDFSEQLHERLQREGVKTHKERVEELNKYLSRLSEHHDMYVLFFITLHPFVRFL